MVLPAHISWKDLLIPSLHTINLSRHSPREEITVTPSSWLWLQKCVLTSLGFSRTRESLTGVSASPWHGYHARLPPGCGSRCKMQVRLQRCLPCVWLAEFMLRLSPSRSPAPASDRWFESGEFLGFSFPLSFYGKNSYPQSTAFTCKDPVLEPVPGCHAYLTSCLLSCVSSPASNFSLCLVRTLCQTSLSHFLSFTHTHYFILPPEKYVSGNSHVGSEAVKKKT